MRRDRDTGSRRRFSPSALAPLLGPGLAWALVVLASFSSETFASETSAQTPGRFPPAFALSAQIAGDSSEESDESRGWCDPYPALLGRSPAHLDLYNAGFWAAGIAGVTFGTNTEQRWSAVNDFDSGIRDGTRLDSSRMRDDANLASDFTLALSAGVLPALSISAPLWLDGEDRDCEKAFALFSEAAESMTFSIFLVQAIKHVTGRARPYTRECGEDIVPNDARCDDDDRKLSFFSGHASLAATGAGLTCSYAYRRNVWGDRPLARLTTCGLGVLGALTTGVLRVAADKHWGTDVLTGFAVGALVGYFDVPGPFDLLKFEAGGSGDEPRVKGVFLPMASDRQVGAQMALVF